MVMFFLTNIALPIAVGIILHIVTKWLDKE
ncbi:TPA: type I toxin-antitoxin system Fst family toxin [Streptococcus equi subsp. ruminatorum]|nr:type I toxin-antitoxin system Fst family toxin [Streptococcus equi subsp. ruminatorum]